MVLAQLARIGQLGQSSKLCRRDLRILDTRKKNRRGALVGAAQQMPDLIFETVGNLRLICGLVDSHALLFIILQSGRKS